MEIVVNNLDGTRAVYKGQDHAEGSTSAVVTGYDPRWPIGQEHPLYGKVEMMAITGGEAYRWLVKDNLVTMIPLSFLQGE